MHQGEPVKSKASERNWLWLSALGIFAFFALTGGKVVLAAGMLLLGVFAFYNDPTKISATIPENPGNVLIFSWACGLAGIIAVISAAF